MNNDDISEELSIQKIKDSYNKRGTFRVINYGEAHDILYTLNIPEEYEGEEVCSSKYILQDDESGKEYSFYVILTYGLTRKKEKKLYTKSMLDQIIALRYYEMEDGTLLTVTDDIEVIYKDIYEFKGEVISFELIPKDNLKKEQITITLRPERYIDKPSEYRMLNLVENQNDLLYKFTFDIKENWFSIKNISIGTLLSLTIDKNTLIPFDLKY